MDTLLTNKYCVYTLSIISTLFHRADPLFVRFIDIATGNYTYQLNDQMAAASAIWPDLWNFYVEAASDVKTPEQVFEAFQKQYVDYMQQQGIDGF